MGNFDEFVVVSNEAVMQPKKAYRDKLALTLKCTLEGGTQGAALVLGGAVDGNDP